MKLPRLESLRWNDPLIRALAATVGLLGIVLVIAALFGPIWGFALYSSALIGLYTCRPAAPAARHDRVPDVPPTRLAARPPCQSVARAVGSETPQSCGICVLDREYRVVWCNDASAAHLGLRPDADRGQPIGRLVREQPFARYLAAGNFSQPLRLKTARCGGMVLSIWVAPCIGAQWLLVSADVTQAARLESARRDCVANALHEMCTPVTVLAGHLDSVKRFEEDPRHARASLEVMEEQCRRMQRLLGDLLQLATLESLPEPPRDERVDVGALLARIRGEIEALSAGRHRIVVESEPGYALVGAEGEIASAFANLATNAVRYTPPGGEIRLIWCGSSAGAEFTVADTGIGIAAEHLPRLTERFFRVDRERSRKSAGTGLGLAIVKDVLARHQATLAIESAPGRGSRFTARFPAHRVVGAAAAEWKLRVGESVAGLLTGGLEEDCRRGAPTARVA